LRSILYYITGHGYGHAVRSQQVICALQRAAGDLRVHVRTSAPDWLFHDADRAVSYSRQAIDIGIVQPNSLDMDIDATWRACRALHQSLPGLIAQEVAFVREQKIDLIAGDIPPLCFEIAARADVPSVAVTNFTWDVIYSAYAAKHPGLDPLIEEMTGFYRRATLALTLPYPCSMSMFARREPIPWISRSSALNRREARAQFGLPLNRKIVLLSFGGIGFDDLPWGRLSELSEFFFVTTGPTELARENLLVLSLAQRRYVDLLRGVDAIVTKPGYGIVADVLAHRLPVLYTERGEFLEYPRLVQALTELGTAEFIPQADLLSGEIRPYLTRLLDKAPHWPEVPLNGAAVAAEKILALGNRRGR
jgi:UDP:flavonoid glycosyltransferase YjiC (YdhE family)